MPDHWRRTAPRRGPHRARPRSAPGCRRAGDPCETSGGCARSAAAPRARAGVEVPGALLEREAVAAQAQAQQVAHGVEALDRALEFFELAAGERAQRRGIGPAREQLLDLAQREPALA